MFYLTFLAVIPTLILGLPLPINIDLQEPSNTNNLSFAVSLPNNDTVQIGLSFRLLTFSNGKSLLNTTNDGVSSYQNDEIAKTTTTTTTTTTDKNVLQKKIVTVEEAIESFRQDLIKKEADISGIIQSKNIFYRHFKLEFDDEMALTIRCSYDSNYNMRSLTIKCYEYHEYETERVLSNGEVEVFMKEDLEYKSDVELLDFKSMKQTYKMEIS